MAALPPPQPPSVWTQPTKRVGVAWGGACRESAYLLQQRQLQSRVHAPPRRHRATEIQSVAGGTEVTKREEVQTTPVAPRPPPCSRLPIRCPWLHKSNLFTSPCCRDAGAAGGNGGPSESCEKHTDVGFPHSPRPVLSPSEPCDQPTVYNNARSADDRSMRQTPPARTPTSTKGSRHRPRGEHSARPRHAHHPRAARPHLTPAKGAHCQCQLRQKEAARSSIRQGEPRGAAAQRGALWGERGKSRDPSHPAAVQTRPSGTRGSSRRRARNRPMYQGTGHTEQ